ncbi:MAG: hypothetical protein H5U25_04160, partial [Oceanibaculum nanhaiense]|nr:hypothetical protein [Oceanibaculum nanhaiense]
MSQTARLTVQRGTAGESRDETHDVPFEPGQSVLDGLRWIRAHRDPALAFRFSCINANACKECMMQLDGKVIYALQEIGAGGVFFQPAFQDPYPGSVARQPDGVENVP